MFLVDQILVVCIADITTQTKMLCLPLFLLCVVATANACAQEQDGILLYREHCSHCHGDNGKGSKSYPDPLLGNLSVNQLAHYIDQTMPEDNPSQVTGESAKAIAETIHPSFYSLIAQEKNKKARLELSRLTVRQMRGVFGRHYRKLSEARTQRQINKGGFVQNTLTQESLVNVHAFWNDSTQRFNFLFRRSESFTGNEIQPERFSIRWDGSVIPPETGAI